MFHFWFHYYYLTKKELFLIEYSSKITPGIIKSEIRCFSFIKIASILSVFPKINGISTIPFCSINMDRSSVMAPQIRISILQFFKMHENCFRSCGSNPLYTRSLIFKFSRSTIINVFAESKTGEILFPQIVSATFKLAVYPF